MCSIVQKELLFEKERINTSQLPDGMYVLKITTATEYYLKRWVKE
jgi:hypothetical protein